MDLCNETKNIYESVAIISKRANQISVEIKQDLSKNLQNLPHITTAWKKYSRTGNKSKFQDIMRSCRNRHYWQHKSLLTVMFIGVTLRKKIKKKLNDTAQTDYLPSYCGNTDYCLSLFAHRQHYGRKYVW